jgi:hypothetical protein
MPADQAAIPARSASAQSAMLRKRMNEPPTRKAAAGPAPARRGSGKNSAAH